MRARRVVISNIGTKKSLEMKLVEDDGMIEALASNRSDEPFNIRILLR
jgi:hypothetical protein